MQGKIIKGIGGFYYVHDGEETVVECRARGSFRSLSLKPLVGDNVRIRLTLEDEASGYIEELLPRLNTLIRPAVANVDQALILVSLSQPAFHPGLLDRFLLWMEYQSVPVIIGINKIDTGLPEKEREIRDIYEGADYRVCSFSAQEGRGLPEIRALLAGKTTVLAGASGVGKSTLLNALMPREVMPTGVLSERLGRGRHTTRHSEIFCFDHQSFLCDTPGFSSLDLPDMTENELAGCFPEFAPFTGECAFRDCRHEKEKICGIRRAVQEGLISQSRYDSYLRFLSELRGRRPY